MKLKRLTPLDPLLEQAPGSLGHAGSVLVGREGTFQSCAF